METMVETAQPLTGFTEKQLKSIADGVESSGALLYGPIAQVSTLGKFAVRCFGGVRFGCFLCDTKGMSSMHAWFQHASSEKHLQMVAKTRVPDPIDELLEQYEVRDTRS